MLKSIDALVAVLLRSSMTGGAGGILIGSVTRHAGSFRRVIGLVRWPEGPATYDVFQLCFSVGK